MLFNFPSKVDPKKGYRYLNGHQFRAETDKCIQCPEKPCNQMCPCNVDPSEFILAAENGDPSDIDYAALSIYRMQPLAAVCGVICPVSHCMSRCSRSRLDASINIPGLQAEIIRRASKNGKIKDLVKKCSPTGKRIAIAGAGPAGLSAAACLAARGHKVILFEKSKIIGGDVTFIPKSRFPEDALKNDIDFIKSLGDLEIKLETSFEKEMECDYDAVIYAIGLQEERCFTCPGKEFATAGRDFLSLPADKIKGKSICVFGCGGVAVDCAIYAKMSETSNLTVFYRRTISQAPLSPEERGVMSALGISVVEKMNIKSIEKKGENLTVETFQCDAEIKEISGTSMKWQNFDYVVSALGQTSTISAEHEKGKVFVCGQARGNNASAVQAAASGKNAAMKVCAMLNGESIPIIQNEFQSNFPVFDFESRPADISTVFDSIKTCSPFIVGASPFTENIHACKKCLDNGFGGVIVAVGPHEGFKPTYRINHNPEYLPQNNISEAVALMKAIRDQYPTAIVGGFVSASNPDLLNAVEAMQCASFIQVDIDSISMLDQVKALPGKNIIITIHGQNCGSAEIAFNISSYKEAMAKFAGSSKLVVLEPSFLKRCANHGEFLNIGLSLALHSAGSSSLAEWSRTNAGFDIENERPEKLINHLTNPYTCIGCGKCTACPNDAIDLQPAKWIYVVDPNKCDGCGLCASVCPTGSCSLITREDAKNRSKKH